MKTNILIQYQGGGYDGCFWEWNYFYIDKQGTFHNIESSGRNGIDNLPDAEQLIIDDKCTTYIYDMNSEQDIETFSKESNAIHVTGVLQWFEDNPDTGVEFFAVCSACDSQMPSCEDITLESDLLLCYECYWSGHCYCCDSYVGETEIIYTGTYAVENKYMNKAAEQAEQEGYDYICGYCLTYKAEQEQEQFENLRWQSFCTGKPDMFSEELRELWI